jgi:pimeloyl-ACP methyl ester carboxylesterase
VSLSGRLVDVEGVRTFVHRSGSGSPILLIHGFLVSHWIWRGVVEQLARHGEVIAFDLPGHGEADRPAPTDFDYTPAGLADHAARLCEVMGLPPAVVLGHSFGGAVALSLAARHPERVRALAAIDAIGLPFKMPLKGQLVLAPGIGELLFKKAYTRAMLHDHLTSAFTDTSLVTEEYVDYYWDRFNRPGGRAASYAMVRAIADTDLAETVTSIRTPTSVIWGERDRIVPVALASKLAALIPGASLDVVPGCGHTPAEEQPEAFLPLCDALFARLQGVLPRAAVGG